jgi:hypothetical protein
MARYQITGAGWPVGQWLIPTGTVIDDVSGTDTWSVIVRERGLPPPVNASLLDQSTYDTYDQMVQSYSARRVGPPR